MKMASMLAVFAVVALRGVTAEQMSPIAKVLEMIADLQTKIIGEGGTSQKVYDEFSEWCEDQSKELKFEIKTAKEEISDLKATIEKQDSNVGSLTTKIEELVEAISTNEADLKAATEIRNKENKVFMAEAKELEDVIDTLQRAIGIIEKEMQGGASMLQLKGATNLVEALKIMVQASAFSAADASKLTALVQSSQEDSDDSLGAPAAAVYKNKSGGILDALGDLLEKANTQLDEARKREQASLNNYNLLKQGLTDEINFATSDMDQAKKNLAAATEKKADAEGELGSTTRDLTEDTKAMSELHHDCMTKAEEFEAETKSRGEELAALAKAKEIIVEATSLSQTSFLQLRSVQHSQVVRFLRELSRKQHSTALAQFASRVEATASFSAGTGDDPFAKIKGLITDMIAKLEEEAEADAKKKAYCDKEMGETNEKIDNKNNEIEKLSTKIDEMTSRSAQLKEEVAGLEKMLSKLAGSQAEMDKLRAEEKAAHGTEEAELSKGLKGIQLALKVLRDYYNNAGDAAHGAAEGAGSGIIGLLEVAESDLAKELAEVQGDEKTAADIYEKETKENEVLKATKEADVKFKSKESVELDKTAAETKSDLSGVKAELAAVNEYMSKLEGECVEKAETYEEKTARREAEIDGLKQALEILDGEAALIQKSSRRSLRVARAHA